MNGARRYLEQGKEISDQLNICLQVAVDAMSRICGSSFLTVLDLGLLGDGDAGGPLRDSEVWACCLLVRRKRYVKLEAFCDLLEVAVINRAPCLVPLGKLAWSLDSVV